VTKYLIVNADDLGISVPVNLAILRAFRSGIVTSASLLANMPAFEHAVEEVIRPEPRLGVGVHLCLTSGRPVLSPEEVPLLVSLPGGQFRHGFLGLWRLICSRRREEALQQIGQELAAQVQRVQSCGICPDHLDSHQHVHAIPAVFDLVVRLARAHRAAVRVASEPLGLGRRGPMGPLQCLANGGLFKDLLLASLAAANRRRRPGILAPDHYFGILDTGRMTPGRLRRLLRNLPDGISEVTVHPGLPWAGALRACGTEWAPGCSRQDARFLRRGQAPEELEGLVDPAVRRELEERRILLIRFADISYSPHFQYHRR
jgi:predicted glycoside hydrolase/deacetylase ChbG (UPF0249 family)